MRIFLTLHPSANLSVPGSMTWYHNLYEPLLDLGHEVVFLRMDEVAKKHNIQFRRKNFKELYSFYLLSTFKKEHSSKPFDLFFSYLTDQDVEEEALKCIKSTGVPMANFSCNNTHQFFLIENISKFFDYNLHSEKDSDIKFRSIGANPVWFPMAANPKYYYPLNLSFKYDVTFLGSAYSKRIYYIWHLLENGIEVNCFGPNWLINPPKQTLKMVYKEAKRMTELIESIFAFNIEKRHLISSIINNYDLQNILRGKYPEKLNYPIQDSEMINLYSQSRINLGFLEVNSSNNSVGSLLTPHLHLREFEIPMSGGLYITNFSEELLEFYEPDKEILVFRNEHELTDKIHYYLTHEDEAYKIRINGYNRAIRTNTYQQRIKDLFMRLEF